MRAATQTTWPRPLASLLRCEGSPVYACVPWLRAPRRGALAHLDCPPPRPRRSCTDDATNALIDYCKAVVRGEREPANMLAPADSTIASLRKGALGNVLGRAPGRLPPHMPCHALLCWRHRRRDRFRRTGGACLAQFIPLTCPTISDHSTSCNMCAIPPTHAPPRPAPRPSRLRVLHGAGLGGHTQRPASEHPVGGLMAGVGRRACAMVV